MDSQPARKRERQTGGQREPIFWQSLWRNTCRENWLARLTGQWRCSDVHVLCPDVHSLHNKLSEDGSVSEAWQTSGITQTCAHTSLWEQGTYKTEGHAVSHSDILPACFRMSVTQLVLLWRTLDPWSWTQLRLWKSSVNCQNVNFCSCFFSTDGCAYGAKIVDQIIPDCSSYFSTS